MCLVIDHKFIFVSLQKMVTDAPFGFPVDRQLKLNSEEENSYMFVFGYRSRNASSGIFEDTEWAGK